MSDQSYAEVLSSFYCTLSYDQISTNAVEKAKQLLLDYLGIVIRAGEEDSSKSLFTFAKNYQAQQGCHIVGTDILASADIAAMINGSLGHSLELDDTYLPGSIHCEAFICATAIAVAEQYELSGKAVVEALVIGYDIAARVAKAAQPAVSNARGFHPTGTSAVFGATAVAAKLLGLNSKQFLNALGIAGTQASGSLEYITDSSWTKRLNAGWAAHAGIIAAQLAQSGFTGPRTVFEGKWGYFQAYSGEPDYQHFVENLGLPFLIEQASIKLFPCCYYIHSPIEAALQIVNQHKFNLTDIVNIEVSLPSAGIDLVCNPREIKNKPKTMLDAQFSLPFNIALAVKEKKVELSHYIKDFFNAKDLIDLAYKIKISPSKRIDALYPGMWAGEVIIKLNSNIEYQAFVDSPRGAAESPPSWLELQEKFNSLVREKVDKCSSVEVVNFVKNIEKQGNIQKSCRQLAALGEIK